jgi:transposase
MSGRRKDTMDVRELIRHIRATPRDRRVARETGVDRRTVKQYRAWAAEQGLLEGPLPTLEDLQARMEATLKGTPPPQNTSSVTPYREVVRQLRQEGVEVAAIWERLKERGYTGSYSAVYRFVGRLEPSGPDATVRVERKPGEEAQVDFGYAGRMIDPETGELRKAWAFVMTLSWSRHQYVEFVFDQKVETWVLLHRHAFEFFGGVPARVTIDNLKAGITRACWDDPQVQAAYRECAEHYGFLILPCRPGTPEHKGKVEQGGVHYVKRNFLAGRRPTLVTQANQDVRVWCTTTAGMRVHGTTREQPLVRFQATEQTQLRPLPDSPYDLALWKVVKLSRDCHITFDNAYYSAPYRLIGQSLRVRGGARDVRIYTLDYKLVATHTRARQPGQRQTHPDHLPPEKLPGLLQTHETCQAEAAAIGPATSQVVQVLLSDPIVDRLPTAGRLVRLRHRFGDHRLEAACARALRFDDIAYKTIKTILEKGLEAQEPTPVLAPAPAQVFVRSPLELVGPVLGGASWN